MKEILEQLQEIKENIDIDIAYNWASSEEKNKFILQSISLASAIGILSSLGPNPNIKK